MTITPAQKTWYVVDGQLVLRVNTVVNGVVLEAQGTQDIFNPPPPEYVERRLRSMLMAELEKVVFPEGLR